MIEFELKSLMRRSGLAQSFWGPKAKNINEAFFFFLLKKIYPLQENFE